MATISTTTTHNISTSDRPTILSTTTTQLSTTNPTNKSSDSSRKSTTTTTPSTKSKSKSKLDNRNQIPTTNEKSHIFYYQNVNGLLTKITQINAEIIASNFLIYAFVETNLNENVASSEIFPIIFNVYRCDRTKNTSKKQSKGGVLIAVHKKFKSQLFLNGEPHGCEQIWVKITHDQRKIYYGTLYIPPNSPSSVYTAHMNLLYKVAASIEPDATVFLCGDFNLPNLNWETADEDTNTFIPTNLNSDEESIVVESCHELGLSQLNYHRNDNDRILDLFWSNDSDPCTCTVCDNHLLHNEQHHKAITVEYFIENITTEEKKTEFYLDFKNADYIAINDYLATVNWDLILNDGNLDDKIHKFYNILNKTITKHVKCKQKRTTTHPRWFNKQSINLKNQMNALHKKFKKMNTPQLRIEYANIAVRTNTKLNSIKQRTT